MSKIESAKQRQQAPDCESADLRVMIVDDHPVVREGFARYIETAPGMKVCCQSGSAAEAFAIYSKNRPDIVLVDLSLQEGSGLELIKDIIACDADAKLIVISGHDEDLYAQRCIRSGAMGYINKHEAAQNIVEAITKVRCGDVYLSQRLSTKLLRRVAGKKSDPDKDPKAALSDRELEVFELLGQGKTINEIAEHLYLSPKTIETYRAHLKDKLGIETSPQLSRRAFQWVESRV